jgi:hypothetical protein
MTRLAPLLLLTAFGFADIEGQVTGADTTAIAPGDSVPARFGFGARSPRVLPESRYTLVDTHRFEEAGAGFRFRFQGPERPTVDVFIYPMARPDAELADSTKQRLVQEQFERGLWEIEVYAERDERELDLSLEPQEFEVETRYGPATALHRRIGFIEEDRPRMDAHLIVLGADLTYIKFRSTFPEERREVGWGHVEALVHELMSVILLGEEALAAPEEPAVPESLPDSFDFRVARTLPQSRYQGQQSQRHPDPAQGVIMNWVGPERPQIRVRVSPVVHPLPGLDEVIADSIRERRLAEELAQELEAFGRTFAEQNVEIRNPDAQPEPRSFETRYGMVAGTHLRLDLSAPEGRELGVHIYLMSIEQQIIRAVSFVDPARGAAWDDHVEAFVEELARTILVTRPPPETP